MARGYLDYPIILGLNNERTFFLVGIVIPINERIIYHYSMVITVVTLDPVKGECDLFTWAKIQYLCLCLALTSLTVFVCHKIDVYFCTNMFRDIF